MKCTLAPAYIMSNSEIYTCFFLFHLTFFLLTLAVLLQDLTFI